MGRRYERGGEVAVVLASRPGGGWYTPNRAIPGCLTEPVIVAMLLRGAGLAEVVAEARRRWPHGDWSGVTGLRVAWVPAGSLVRVTSHLGVEHAEAVPRASWVEV